MTRKEMLQIVSDCMSECLPKIKTGDKEDFLESLGEELDSTGWFEDESDLLMEDEDDSPWDYDDEPEGAEGSSS